MTYFFVWLFLLTGTMSLADGLPSFADIVDKTKSSVVNIRSLQTIPPRKPRLDPYQFFFNERLPQNKEASSLGSGVIINAQGLILTNYHVVAGSTTVQIQFADIKGRVEAAVIGSDQPTDLALLKARLPKAARPADLGDSDKIRVGDLVLAIGNPFGYGHTVTNGIISAKGRIIGTGPYDGFLQTNAAIHPGNSGGPLIDMRGRVIGINAAVDADAYGIGFAIPINVAKRALRQLQTSGSVLRPWLGVVAKNMYADDAVDNAYDPVGAKGVIVGNLIVESPAHKAGIKMGDVIVAIDGKRISDTLTLKRNVEQRKSGDQLAFKIYRRDKGYVTVNVVLGALPSADELPKERDLL